MTEARSSSSEPWSEVPPELEEMLRAELARKSPQGSAEANVAELAASAMPLEEIVEVDALVAAADKAPAKPARKPRTTTKKAPAKAEPAAAKADKPAPAKRTTRTRSTKSTASSASTAEAATDDAPEAEAKKPTRRRTTKSAAAEEG